jgi:diadenosine tetraphosphate (Ap4A) HIT family hydrolase
MSNCYTCGVLAGRHSAPGGTIYEDACWEVGHISDPVLLPGYLIIKLRRHCEHLADLTPEEAATLGPVVQRTCLALARILNPAKIYVCSFGEGVQHIHFHVIPSMAGMPAGSYAVFLWLWLRRSLHRIGIKKWVHDPAVAENIAAQLRHELC